MDISNDDTSVASTPAAEHASDPRPARRAQARMEETRMVVDGMKEARTAEARTRGAVKSSTSRALRMHATPIHELRDPRSVP